MAKPNLYNVDAEWARIAIANSKKINETYTHYILCSYRVTGSMDAGCDAKDLIAWYKVNMPDEYKTKGGK